MARWIHQTPPEQTSAGEQRAAELLSSLGPGFTIRWGFFYTDAHNNSREGDFVIQGPDGHVLVLECKGGELAWDPESGRWSTADGKNPYVQLENEWIGVRQLLSDQTDKTGDAMPFVDKALALPDVSLSPDETTFLGQPRNWTVSGDDLRNLSSWWKARFGDRFLKGSIREAQALFEKVFAAGVPSGASHYTLDFADLVIERQMRCRFEILDVLRENDQLLFRGGPGTGKTWLAIEQAARWAKDGRRVLFLCYNVELESVLRAICSKRSKDIEVFCYESLAAKFGITPDPNLTGANLSEFYDDEIPRRLIEVTQEKGSFPQYDALVVDEAQDHNTGCAENAGGRAGWWTIYLRLLSKGGEAQIAVFYDPAQRLPLRGGHFNVLDLCDGLINPIHVRVDRPLRYTRQLRKYLASLSGENTQDLLQDFLNPVSGMPEGPEPELFSVEDDQSEAKACAELVKTWLRRSLVRPGEIALLYPSTRRPPAWLGKVHGVRFESESLPDKDSVRAIAIHRAKGLERRAIILVGFRPWEQTSLNDYQAMTFIMGATRAQQLLGVIERVDRAESPSD